MRVEYKPCSNSLFYYWVGLILCQWCSNHDCPGFDIILYNVFCIYFSTVLLFSDSESGNPTHIGSIDPNCDVAAVVEGNF